MSVIDDPKCPAVELFLRGKSVDVPLEAVALSGCGVLAMAAVMLPFAMQSITWASIDARIDQARPQVIEADILRGRIASSATTIDAVAVGRNEAGAPIEAIALLTDLLPDDTVLTQLSARQRKLTISGRSFTNVKVSTHDGRMLSFYDDLLRGKIVLINFFYTSCDEVCPLVTQNLCFVHDMLAPRMGKDIFMYSISLQPERDTPERLAAYARTYGVGPGWLLLTGKPDDIELLRHRLGFVDSDPLQDADPEQHLGTVRIANEPMHRWIMMPGLLRKPEG